MKSAGIRTWVTWQKTVLFFQVMTVLGLLIQVGMFFALLLWGRPTLTGTSSVDTPLILNFFVVAAVWVMTINAGIWLFWWITKQGRAQLQLVEETEETPL